MSPILLRPSREQDEHDRLARHLEARYAKKKLDVFVNVRDEQLMPVKFGNLTLYPDLVLGDAKKLAGVVEIETGESVNNLEVLAQWVHFGKARVPFYLYVPAHMYEATRRLCDTYKVRITEVWTYRGAVDGFDLVRLHADGQTKFPKPSTVLKPNPPKPVVIPPPPPPPPPPAPVKGAVGMKGRAPFPPAKPGMQVSKGKVAVAPVPVPAVATKALPAVKPGIGKITPTRTPVLSPKVKVPAPAARSASKPAPKPVGKPTGKASPPRGQSKSPKRSKPVPAKKPQRKKR